ncbi:hypothetical protein MRX96_053032 [Rhipicephalus microplus]
MSVPEAIAAIRSTIALMSDVKERLECICAIYTCLMSNRAIGPWILYHAPRRPGGTFGPLLADDGCEARSHRLAGHNRRMNSRVLVGSGERKPDYGPRRVLLHILDFVSVRRALQTKRGVFQRSA